MERNNIVKLTSNKEKLTSNKDLLERIEFLEKEVARLNSMRSAPNKDYLTTEEAAEWIGVSIATIKRIAKEGILVPIYPNAARKYHKKDVLNYMKGNISRR